MAGIPANFSRVPNLLSSRIQLSNINRTNVALFKVQEQISTGAAINRFSDDPVKAATISTLDERLQKSEQYKRNLSHADASLGLLDSTLGEVTDLANQAKQIAVGQLNVSSSATERSGQATVIDQMISSLLNLANKQGVAGYVFGGATAGRQAVNELGTGFQYTGQGSGLNTDIGLVSTVPITIGSSPIAGLSARVRGSIDLNPALSTDTKLSDVDGARSVGISLGTIEFAFNGGARASVDLSGSDTVRDVNAKLTAAIRQYETDNSVTVLGAGGISTSGESISADIVAGGQLQFFDIGTANVAADLGLRASSGAPLIFSPTQTTGVSLAPKLTLTSPLTSLAGLTLPLTSLRISNAGRSADVDLSGATNIREVKNLIEGTNLGVRVDINADGTGIDVLSDTSTGRDQALSIGEVAGGTTASKLGIRSLDTSTRLADFNDGSGVRIINGSTDPITGLPAPQNDIDFEIVLGNAAGTTITIDLRPQDITTVQTLLARITAEAAPQLAAAGLNPTDLQVALAGDGNGMVLVQNPAFTSAIRVNPRNNSPAAEQLGFLKGTYVPASASFVSQDRAKARPDTIFSHLIDLRDALRANDTRGISLASEKLDGVISSLSETRGLVGSFAQRIEFASQREEDKNTLDLKVRSDLKDLDFTEAATRFSLLQTQLEAGLRVTGQASQLTLLDFLG
jgi:flagellar hook-associated protein 3 FlgL